MAALILSLVAAQDPKQEREKQKEFEKQVSKAVADFQKAYNQPNEDQRAAAIDILKGLVHDRVFAEIARCLNDAPVVRKKAIQWLAGVDHPRSAELLAAAVRQNVKSKDVIEQLIKAMDTVKWDIFFQAIGELIAEKHFDPELSGTVSLAIQATDRIGSMAFIEPLIKCLKKIDAEMQNPLSSGNKDNERYREGVRSALKSCCGGEDKPDGKAYEEWWGSFKSTAEQKARWVMWCKATMKRWDRLPGDTKAYCPHHADKKEAGRDPQIVAMRALK